MKQQKSKEFSIFCSVVSFMFLRIRQINQMLEDDRELEISLSIGNNKFLITVPERANLPHLVRQFLASNKLPSKYEASIIRLVEEKIATHLSPNIIKENCPNPKHQTMDSNSSELKAGKLPHDILRNNRLREVLVKSEQQSVFGESQRVYEGWKQKQKEKKDRVKTQNEQKYYLKTKMHHSKYPSDYLYHKGISFIKKCQENREKQFHKLNPFRISTHQLTENQKASLFNRLHQSGRHQCDHTPEAKHTFPEDRKVDPIKEHLKREDDKIDRQIFRMIREGRLTPTAHSKAKSPFRKTIFN